mmetsp:Transcript_28651/g.66433  ORF Transcript_28651/g.66433 Transcript_28651/m.66433 type:complete len:225 (-) Transcript_28651:1420-2094(-)
MRFTKLVSQQSESRPSLIVLHGSNLQGGSLNCPILELAAVGSRNKSSATGQEALQASSCHGCPLQRISASGSLINQQQRTVAICCRLLQHDPRCQQVSRIRGQVVDYGLHVSHFCQHNLEEVHPRRLSSRYWNSTSGQQCQKTYSLQDNSLATSIGSTQHQSLRRGTQLNPVADNATDITKDKASISSVACFDDTFLTNLGDVSLYVFTQEESGSSKINLCCCL